MASTFPYPIPELDLGAPFDQHRAVVKPEWIDFNGHMNVGYYLIAFDGATDTFTGQLGADWPYVQHKLGMTFVLEAHITYDREVRKGDPLRITTQVLDFDAKRLHMFHRMHHAEEGWLAATNELMMINIDYETRRSAAWLPESLRRLEAIAGAHASLERPPQAGRVIGIRRK